LINLSKSYLQPELWSQSPSYLRWLDPELKTSRSVVLNQRGTPPQTGISHFPGGM